jgi:hypothetical protein
MKLRVADRVAGQFFNTLDALMQGVAMETQPAGVYRKTIYRTNHENC